MEVRTGHMRTKIYEDRLDWGYRQLAEFQPHAVLACLGADSYEMLRLAPPGVARIGLIQSDDPLPYRMARGYAPWMDAMVGVSEGIAETLRAMPEFENKKVAAIPYGIAFGPVILRPRNNNRKLRIVYIGRIIEEQKRISRIIELIKILPVADFHFTIVGTGPQEKVFREAVGGRSNVSILGPTENAKIGPILADQDISVLLSDYEGLPLSLLESMGHGVVPLVSDISGGVREAVCDECGIRVSIGDVAAAVAALQTLFADRPRIEAMSAAATARARQYYSAASMARRYVELIQSIQPHANTPSWPARKPIPVPLGLAAWKFQGVMRRVRRLLKRVIQ
jgi:glycosyltransferase involved in cell wall biosynthesis